MEYTAVLRIEKRKKADLKKMADHNERTAKMGLGHVDESRWMKNNDAIFDVRPIWERVLKRVGDTAKRKDATCAAEMVLTAHQDFFKDDRAGKAAKLQAAALEFSLEVWGKENVVSCLLHDDEAAPHIHVVAVPRSGDSLSWNKFIKTKFDLSRLQDRWHAIANAHGLKLGRGTPAEETKAKHTKPRRSKKSRGMASIVEHVQHQMGVWDDLGQYSTVTLAELDLMDRRASKPSPAPVYGLPPTAPTPWQWKPKKRLTR
jgi:hypothetical protein